MTLADLLASPLPPSDELQALALLFDSALAQRLVNVQAWHGDPRCTAFPVATSDSRWLHTADILLACLSPDGMYRAGFSHLDSSRFDEIEVVPLADVEVADPQPPQLTPEENPDLPPPEGA